MVTHGGWLPATFVLLCLSVQALGHAETTNSRIEAAFQKFWAATSPSEAAGAIDEIVASKVSFKEAFTRLKGGRSYGPAKAGVLMLSNPTENGVVHNYAVFVPDGYNPARRYPVRFQLHGGVHEKADDQGRIADIRPLIGAEQIDVVPEASEASPWWSDDQILNLRSILDTLRRRYNIDENRVAVSGESDGGAGAYFVGMCDTTPYASFLPLNAFIMVLGNEGMALNDQIFPNNLRNKPLFVVNGAQDPLYSTDRVNSSIEHMKKNGVLIDYHPLPKGGHDTTWWPELMGPFESFVTAHPRNPLPDRLTWQVASEDRWNRAHWLVIDKLADPADDPTDAPEINRFSVKNDVDAWPLFAYQPPSGRVDLKRIGNTIEAVTDGVAEFTLLLSPDRIDFRRPVKVIVNDSVVFESLMEPSVHVPVEVGSGR